MVVTHPCTGKCFLTSSIAVLRRLARTAVLAACLLVPGSAHATATPIKHLVVIFDENVSFDHYFGTYPKAANPTARRSPPGRNTPKVNGLSKPRC